MDQFPRWAAPLRPLVNAMAQAPTGVHGKLRAGFLTSAGLLVALAILSVAILGYMAQQVGELDRLQENLDRTRQMEYLVVAQSHYRAMALLTHDPSNLAKLADAKAAFLVHLDAIEQLTSPSMRGILARVRGANDRFAEASTRVVDLESAGRDDEAMALHLRLEHPVSHDVESAMTALQASAEQEMVSSRDGFESGRRLLVGLVAAFAALGVGGALLLGFVLSWSFVIPLRRINATLAQIAAGHFGEQLSVPNRDEFGTLAANLTVTSGRLATLYDELGSLNAQLRGTNTELLGQLEGQVAELARSRRLITAGEERVRRDIAELLHSRVQNRLLMAWYRAEDCQLALATDPAQAAQILAELRDQLDAIREQDVRELSHRLHPSIIRTGLAPALERLTDDFTGRLEIELHVDDAVAALDEPAHNQIPDAVRLSAYRAVEEALGNIARHAEARHAELRLALADGQLEVTVRDDGRGFDPRQVQAGLGLGTISAHVGRVGGTWTIGSAPGAGTTLRVLLPLVAVVEEAEDGLGRQVPFGQEHRTDSGGERSVVPVV
jgi:signal transduction histidine kinase